MEIRFIRNATMVLRYAGRTMLGDPMFGDVASWMPVMNWPSPTVPLPVPVAEILDGVEASLITHTHLDHFDAAAWEAMDTGLPLFGQPADDAVFAEKGFTDVRPITEPVTWEGITITRVGGTHGVLPIEGGPVSGFVLQAAGEPTVYWCGDTILDDEVRATIDGFAPDVIITHSGGVLAYSDGGPATMDAPQTIEVARLAPSAVVVAIHLEAISHCTVSRPALRRIADLAGIPPERLRIPVDGERIPLP
jgi:L-ascorbate metabolism protein UlaG (beta-lactamase superfamily)